MLAYQLNMNVVHNWRKCIFYLQRLDAILFVGVRVVVVDEVSFTVNEFFVLSKIIDALSINSRLQGHE